MKFNIIHIIICIFVFVGCTQQTVNNSVECFTIKESGSSLVYCSDTLKSKIQMEIIKGHYTVETKEVFAIVSNPKHLSLGYDSAWNLEKWENSQWRDRNSNCVNPKQTKLSQILLSDKYL